ncbi:histidine phosphatase family protein [Bifidobacterium castoris]|uniref:Phosphoglycerate mutase n=1 Tax=Bifidobacterium castoris TaxID=2306972 RepID=A0A430F7R8_9BIFI|nr:histidine phosphatase family protein [Bifidobacterium castoris]RSX48896.1 phosphoglycerate mutase [Bifidobacterium castoris]
MTAIGTVRSITLVRHGRTSYNLAGRVQGGIDIPLDDVGLWQARKTGDALRTLYVERDPGARQLVVASDLRRASRTAHLFADPLGLEVHPDPRLRERSFGDWEGMSGDELDAQWPEDFAMWCRGLGGEMRHHAESHEHAGARGVEALRDWSHRADADTDLFVFSHGALIENTLQVLFGIGAALPDFVSVTSMRNAHWARLVNAGLDDPDRWILVDYNHGPALADTELWENPTRHAADTR